MLLAERILCQVEREAIGVVEAEGGGAGERRAVGQARELVVEDAQAAVEGGLEAGFLAAEGLLDQRLGPAELGEGGAHLGDEGGDELSTSPGPAAPRRWAWRMARRMMRRST